MAHLALCFLGPFQATLDGQAITAFESNKVRALLAYLAVEADRPHSRHTLAGLFWPDYPDQAALGNLRHTLYNLRVAIGDPQAIPPFLSITHETIQFNPTSDCSLDLSVLPGLAGLKIERLEQAVTAYRGSFLEEFFLGDSAPFEEWVLYKREQIGRLALTALRRLADHYECSGEYERVVAFARRQLELEPWDEEAHQQLMRALALSGQRTAALAQYEICRRLLRQELDLEPSREIAALYETIRAGTLTGVRGARDKGGIPGVRSFLVEPRTAEHPRPVFVARERELTRLACFFNAALAGEGRVVFVTGEPGSGKTVLIQEFVRQAMESHRDLIVAQGNGAAHIGIGDPYLPFIETLQMLTGDVEARWAGGAITRMHASRLRELLPDAVQTLMDVGPELIDRFLPGAVLAARAQAYVSFHSERTDTAWQAQLDELLKRRATLPPNPTGLQQGALFEQYTGVMQALARRHPLILVLDDLQWADGGSINLLFHLGKQLSGSRILIVGAYRPDEVTLGCPAASSEQGARHPLAPVIHEFQRDWGDIDVDLAQAEGRQFVEALLDAEPNDLGEAFRQTLFQHTGGHPLFTVELLRGLQERGDIHQDRVGRWIEGPSLNWNQLPARVEAVIAERVGRLPDEWRALLIAASVEGGEFTAEAVARVQGTDAREIIRCLSDELSRRRPWVSAVSCRYSGAQQLSRYRFRHDLFQKYLYHSLDEVERAHLHAALGGALEALYGEQAAQEAVALAWHFEAAGQTSKAVGYLLQAGERAARLAANQEAIVHLTRGLTLLQALPESPERDRRELALQLALVAPLIASKGYAVPEVGRVYTRARELCRQMGESPELFMTRIGLAGFYLVRAEYPTALELAEQLLTAAQQSGDPHQLTVPYWIKGYSLLCLGELVHARALLEQALALYDPQQHRAMLYLLGTDISVYALGWLSLILLALGYPNQALQRSREALRLAREIPYPFILAHALAIAGAVFSDLRRDQQATQAYAEELVNLGDGAGILQRFGAIYQGCQQVAAGKSEKGIALMRRALDALWAVGHWSNWSHLLSKLIEGYGMAGQVTAGLDTVATALAFGNRTGERFYESSLYRLRGELLWRRGDVGAAEASLRQAIEIARQQQARLWELRATLSLSRLLETQGRRQEIQRELAERYAWFTEGFDTPDLQEAQAWLAGASRTVRVPVVW